MELSRFHRVTEASAHGRFQPFHNEHLEYVLAAQKLCDFLWIGITKYDVTSTDLNPLGAVRERPENNPLTFFERAHIIRESLIDAGVPGSAFGFVPFPIETPQRLHSFMATSVVCYTTICEQWNRDKIDVLKAQAYDVRVLWERPTKKITGAAVRSDILEGGSAWRSMVPAATARAVEQLDLRNRLLKLSRLDCTAEPLSGELRSETGAQ
jgi:nicotinamide mononucleotide adenylyltransferase